MSYLTNIGKYGVWALRYNERAFKHDLGLWRRMTKITKNDIIAKIMLETMWNHDGLPNVALTLTSGDLCIQIWKNEIRALWT